jgi:hypothetical protein
MDLNSHGPSTASGYQSSLATTLRRSVGWNPSHTGAGASSVTGSNLNARELGQLAYLMDRYAATTSATTAAAVEHAERLLTIGGTAQTNREKVRWASTVKAHPDAQKKFQSIWQTTKDQAGPYKVTFTWKQAPTAHTAGTGIVTVTSAAGKPVKGVPVTVNSPAAATSQATSTSAAGTAAFTVKAMTAGTLAVTATASDLTSSHPMLYTPDKFNNPASDDAKAQRMIGSAPRVSQTATATATVTAATPAIVTTASSPTAVRGTDLYDNVQITGTVPGYTGTATATLWGPYDHAPTKADCIAGGPVPGRQVTFAVTGDGTYVTPRLPAALGGWYVWTETLPGTPLQNQVTTPCGIAEETTKVVSAPVISTTATSTARPGQSIHDTMTVTGADPNITVTGHATLYGPFDTAPTAGSCAPATKIRTVNVTVKGDGVYTLPAVTATYTGYYAWVAGTAAAPLQNAAGHACGVPSETSKIVRADGPAFRINTGGAGYTAAAAASTPRLKISGSSNVNAPLVTSKTDGDTVTIPDNIKQTAQWNDGARVGDKLGTILVVGHVSDSWNHQGGLFNLKKAKAGDIVTLTDVHGKTQKFKITSLTRHKKGAPLPKKYFAQDKKLSLVIVSCVDDVKQSNGTVKHANNLVVQAVPVA